VVTWDKAAGAST